MSEIQELSERVAKLERLVDEMRAVVERHIVSIDDRKAAWQYFTAAMNSADDQELRDLVEVIRQRACRASV